MLRAFRPRAAPLRRFSFYLALTLGLGSLAACATSALDEGEACLTGTECQQGLCYGSVCLAPEGDLDGDGLSNLTESTLSTNAESTDSDGDGLSDGQEVGDDTGVPRDTDGDFVPGANQRHDANESALTDGDGDCIADQFDADDNQVEVDMDVVAKASCRQFGVCDAEEAVVIATCSESGVDCSYEGVDGWESQEVSCDAKDNDCDGLIDEGIVYATGDGELAPIGAECAGKGICSDQLGVVECGDTGGAICSTSAGGSEGPNGWSELPCNGLDDDCDGVTDGIVTYIDADGVPLPVGAECSSPGICHIEPGVVTCLPGTDQAVCSTGPGGPDDLSQPEVCNGSDDDCDGAVDESLFFEPAGEGEPLLVGESCGVSGTACEGMVVACYEGKPTCCMGTLPCVPWEEIASEESCDGGDNDCDGLIDEDADMGAQCALADGLCASTEGVVGSCEAEGAEFTLSCDYSGVTGWELEETLCDGHDNDCDGGIDEGLVAGEGEDALPLGQSCSGVGACLGETGTVTCNGLVARCDALGAATLETCNGIDDDCDDLLDEETSEELEAPGDLSCVEVGVCAEASQDVVCVDGQAACGYMALETFEPAESLCDGLDNDCDGWTDEGTAKLFTGALDDSVESQPVDRSRWRLVAAEGGPLLFGGLHRRPLDVGELGGRPLDDLWRYDGESVGWTRLASAPTPLAGHAATWSAGLQGLVVHGGFSLSVSDTEEVVPPAQDEMWFWHAESNAWHEIDQTGSSTVLARVDHSLVSLNDGRLLLHGGGGITPGEAQTWVGVLSVNSDDTGTFYTCDWLVAPHQGAPRKGHQALLDQETGRVLLVGGVTDGPGSFATVLDIEGGVDVGGESSLGDLGKAQPALRTDAAIAMADGVVVVVGGRSTPTDGSPPSVLSDAWRYDTASDMWTSFVLPEGVPGLGGSFLMAQDGVWSLGAGDSGVPVSWRQSWTLDAAALTWLGASSWAGLAPRTGAVVVVEESSGRTWVVGGSRMPGGFALMDAHSWSWETHTWKALNSGLAPMTGGVDVTRPGLEGAGGVWNPVDQVVLLAGGRDVATGSLSTALWQMNPDATEPQAVFSKVTTYGDAPSGIERPIFGVDSASTGWLAGRFHLEQESNSEPKTVFRIYSLDLSGYAWTLAWDGEASEEASFAPGTVAHVAGGVGNDGLELMTIDVDGDLALWRFIPSTGAMTSVPLDVQMGSLSGLGAWGYDHHAHSVLATMTTVTGTALVRIDWSGGVVESLSMDSDWPDTLNGVGVGVHPVAGVMFVGGHDPGGYTTSSWSLAGQTCD